MNCEQAEIFMMKYFDRELDDLEYTRLQKHLGCCERCRVDFDNLKEVLSAVENDAMVEPPEEFDAEVMAKINYDRSSERKKASGWLVLLYNSVIVISTVLLIVFMSDAKGIEFVKTLKQIGACLTSFASLVQGMFITIMGMFEGIIDTMRIMQQVGAAIAEEDLYAIGALLLIILGMKNLFTAKAGQNREN